MIGPSSLLWIVDFVGPIFMIVFSFLCLRYAYGLKRRDAGNVIWTYLQWFCWGLAGFAISRSVGHIAKGLLVISDHGALWGAIRPFSGGVNTFMLLVVASITLFFQRIWNIYRQINRDKQALQAAHEDLLYFNQHLEHLVTERTEALAFSEHKYRRIFEISKDMILVTDKAGRITDLNPTGSALLGKDEAPETPIGRSLADFFADPADWRAIEAAIDMQGFIHNTEADLVGSAGLKRQYLISGSLDRGAADHGDTIHFLMKDIEERRLMQKQIAQADKLASIGELSAGIAHEINNPIGIILGYTQLMLRDEMPGTEKHNDLKVIEKHVKNCKTIVEDMLNFARSSSPEKEAIKIHTLIDDVVTFLRQRAGMDRLNIVTDYDPDAPAIRVDAKKIKQVFINLIINAQHAVGEKGTIRVDSRFDADGDRLSIAVRDDGHGITPKDMARIFDPFFTTKPTGEGTGLGLSVSYGIIKNHGGEITVESEPGLGTVFTVVLPATASPGGNGA